LLAKKNQLKQFKLLEKRKMYNKTFHNPVKELKETEDDGKIYQKYA
jgi:hypothetical protein